MHIYKCACTCVHVYTHINLPLVICWECVKPIDRSSGSGSWWRTGTCWWWGALGWWGAGVEELWGVGRGWKGFEARKGLRESPPPSRGGPSRSPPPTSHPGALGRTGGNCRKTQDFGNLPPAAAPLYPLSHVSVFFRRAPILVVVHAGHFTKDLCPTEIEEEPTRDLSLWVLPTHKTWCVIKFSTPTPARPKHVQKSVRQLFTDRKAKTVLEKPWRRRKNYVI